MFPFFSYLLFSRSLYRRLPTLLCPVADHSVPAPHLHWLMLIIMLLLLLLHWFPIPFLGRPDSVRFVCLMACLPGWLLLPLNNNDNTNSTGSQSPPPHMFTQFRHYDATNDNITSQTHTRPINK